MEVKLNSIELFPLDNKNSIENAQKTDTFEHEILNKTQDMPEIKLKNEKEYSHEDAVMDLEAIKRFFYMLAGIEYVPKNEFGYEKRSEIWA
ncbi:MAG: hypothetical protein JW982_13245 [Spirochaetes bacterium]|nr:hypothetical protein [Spirochaetota bacterium]